MAITTQAPRDGAVTMPIPQSIKPMMGLDPTRASSVVIDEANSFFWPGHDLVPQQGGGFVRGTVTAGFLKSVSESVGELIRMRRLRVTDRGEADR